MQTRRDFLRFVLAGAAASAPTNFGWAQQPGSRVRATSGDPHEPDWQQRLTVQVGPTSGDIVGRDEKAIQAAIDYVARLGGGTVELLPGTYLLRNAVWLRSRVRLTGHGLETVLTRGPSVTSPLAADSDWYDQEITIADARPFQLGDGVLLTAKSPAGGKVVLKRTLVARSGNRFKLDRPLRKNLWVSLGATVTNLFPLVTAENEAEFTIESLVLDGNRDQCANLNGNYGGCIFLQDCRSVLIRDVVARNYNGDGISIQICHDVVVERCHCHDNADLGLHPGSGSQRPILRENVLERNSIGLFWCWGVKFGLAENNRIVANKYGISIGHNDTDNVMRQNEIRANELCGVLFRDESGGRDFWPHRNRLESNRILDNGPPDGAAVDIRGPVRDLVLVGNEIRETRSPARRVGIRIGPQVGPLVLKNNQIDGFWRAVLDQRSG